MGTKICPSLKWDTKVSGFCLTGYSYFISDSSIFFARFPRTFAKDRRVLKHEKRVSSSHIYQTSRKRHYFKTYWLKAHSTLFKNRASSPLSNISCHSYLIENLHESGVTHSSVMISSIYPFSQSHEKII